MQVCQEIVLTGKDANLSRGVHIETAVVPEVDIEVAGEDLTRKIEIKKIVANESEISALPRQRST